MATTIWADSIFNLSIAAGTLSLLNLGFPTLSELQRRIERFTLIRTIIGVDVQAAVRDSGEGDQLVDLGIGVFSDQADTVAELPSPGVPEDFPLRGWVWRARYRIYASAVDDQNVVPRRVDLDMRSQRKLENGRPRLIVANTNNQGQATAIAVTGMIRMLYLVG